MCSFSSSCSEGMLPLSIPLRCLISLGRGNNAQLQTNQPRSRLLANGQNCWTFTSSIATTRHREAAWLKRIKIDIASKAFPLQISSLFRFKERGGAQEKRYKRNMWSLVFDEPGYITPRILRRFQYTWNRFNRSKRDFSPMWRRSFSYVNREAKSRRKYWNTQFSSRPECNVQ